MADIQPQNTAQNPDAIIMEISETAAALRPTKVVNPSSGNLLVDWYNKLNSFTQGISRIKAQDKVSFFQLLAVMLHAGVPLVQSLHTLADQFKNAKLRGVVIDLARRIEAGARLSDSMGEHHGIFTDAQVGMVAAGEASGNMNKVLNETAKYLEESATLSSKVKGAMVYPIVIFALLIAVTIVIMVYVIPKIKDLFSDTGQQLPVFTRVFISISDTIVNHGGKVALVIALFVGLIIAWGRTPNGHYHIDKIKLHLPVIGNLLRQVSLSRFARTLSSLIKSGIPIVRCLQINAETIGNAVYREKILMIAEDVQRGIPIAENLGEDSFLFPSTLVNMVSIGEQTAQLDSVLTKIADFYEQRVNIIVASLTKLMEPVVMIGMGVIVGGVVLAVLMPMIQLTDLAESV